MRLCTKLDSINVMKIFHRVTPAAIILQDPQAVKQNEKSPAMSLVIGMFSIVYAATTEIFVSGSRKRSEFFFLYKSLFTPML